MSHWCQSIYETSAPQILLYGRALGLSHSESEDVLQETFVALMQKDDGPEQPLHYCLRAFRNKALNYKRAQRPARHSSARDSELSHATCPSAD